MNVFENADEAFDFYFDEIQRSGIEHSGAVAIFNEVFTILNPRDSEIKLPWRKWQRGYADNEIEWYLSGDPNIKRFEAIRGDKPVPAIWYDHADEDGNVRSNYGWQWQRNQQIDYIVQELQRNQESRRALVTLYDGKEHDTYGHDTPCTLNYHWQVVEGKVNMTVMMRSNDLVWGFCNDQYVAAFLLDGIAQRLALPVGELTWFASNLHIYPQHLNMRKEYVEGINKRV